MGYSHKSREESLFSPEELAILKRSDERLTPSYSQNPRSVEQSKYLESHPEVYRELRDKVHTLRSHSREPIRGRRVSFPAGLEDSLRDDL